MTLLEIGLVQTDIFSRLTEKMGGLALSNITNYVTILCKNVIVAILIYWIGKMIIGKLLTLVRKIMQKRGLEPSLYSFLDSLITICMYFVLAIAIISVLGIETSSFVALFASAGVAIGMALSGTLQNFAGGVMILIFRPYVVGDTITAQGFTGIVKQIQIFNTVLLTPDNQTIIIPNGGLSTGSLTNLSKQDFRRIDIDVEVAYGTKPEDVRRILQQIIDADERVMKEKPHAPAMPMTTMAASSIIFSLRIWAETANYWNVKFDTTEKVYTALTEAGIEIPFQQMDVHVINQ